MINIGTNFLYEGPLFLDERHGIARSKSDLLNWSIPIPDGFEVYLDLSEENGGPSWYTYNSKLEHPLEDTGYFVRRLDRSWVEGKVNEIKVDILNINNQITQIWNTIESIDIQPSLTLDVTSNAGIRLINESVIPNINWTLKNYGSEIDYSKIDSFTVNGVSYTPSSPWNNNGQAINTNQSYLLTVTYLNQTLEKTISYTFKDSYDWIKYFGTSPLSTLSSINDLQKVTDPNLYGWGTPSVAYTGLADCSAAGGKYPYYIIPTSIYNQNTFKMFVGGFRTTDFETFGMTIGGIGYTAIRTGYIQTGRLQIRYE